MYKTLIVDDERMIREGMKKVIPWESIGISEVFTAASGAEAIRLMEENPVDIIITDISMTEMTGIEMVRQMMERWSNFRVIILTGYDSFEYARECLRMKVEDFLLKPVDEVLLTECIKKQVNYLEEKKKQEQAEIANRRSFGTVEQMELERYICDLIHNRNREEALCYVKERVPYSDDIKLLVAVLNPQLSLERTQQEGIFQIRQIQNICLEFIDAKEYGLTVSDMEVGQIILILFTEKCGGTVSDFVDSILEILKDELQYLPKMVIGNEVEGIHQVHTSYQDALYLLQSKESNIHKVLYSQSILKRRKIFQEVFEELKSEICNNISDEDYVLHVYDTFCMAVESYGLSETSVKKCCYELIADIHYAYIVAGGNTKEQGPESFLKSISGSSIEECKKLGRTFICKMLENEQKDVHEIVEKAKAYINQHLSENLSVASLAELTFVSPNYFSRLFKRVTGHGCNEYIVRKRIEKACTLLEMTNFNTGKIADMVGYNDTNYFSLAFKKHCGVTPTSYRNQIRKKNSFIEEETNFFECDSTIKKCR